MTLLLLFKLLLVTAMVQICYLRAVFPAQFIFQYLGDALCYRPSGSIYLRNDDNCCMQQLLRDNEISLGRENLATLQSIFF